MSKKNVPEKAAEKAAEKVVELRKETPPPAQEEVTEKEVVKILPVRVSDIDRVTVLLAGEKVKRSQAELQAISLKLNSIDAELKAFDAAEKSLLKQVWEKYTLGPEDTFDSNTGLITRKATPAVDGSLSTK